MNRRSICITAVTAIALALRSVGASAQVKVPDLVDPSALNSGLFGGLTQNLTYLGPGGTPSQPGKSFMETIQGNGTRAGYTLSHGGIIPDSVRVSVGPRSLRANTEYYLDAANGMLAFAEPVRRMETIRISYRYIESADGSRSPLGLQGLTLNLKGASLNFGYGLSSDKAKGLDFNTYGFGFSSTAKSGSTLNGLFYISTPTGSQTNLRRDLTTDPKKQAKIDPKDAVTDRLIVQDMNLKAGKANFRASYQDVGQRFSGFQAMRQTSATNAAALAQINALEKEKGVTREGLGFGLALNKTSNVGIDWDKIGDGKGSIVKQGLNYKSGGFNFGWNQRAISNTFTRFNDLREEDRAQLAKEKGVKRNDLSLGFSGKTGAFGFTENSFGDTSGEMLRRTLSLGGKGFSLGFASHQSGSKFTRMNDLTDAEKTALALDIHRQYDPNAQAAAVTAKDKEQIGLEAGLSRTQLGLTTAMGKKGSLTFGQSTIGDDKGKIERRSLNMTGQGFAFSYLDQNISKDFGRLARLSDFERGQLANEHGIHRTNIALNLAPDKGTTLGFSQLSLSDQAGGMTRQSMGLDTKGLSLRFNMANTDSKFNRAADLAMPEAERNAIAAERGYKRMDFSAKVTAFKGLTLDTYNYNARNDTDKLAKETFRHNLLWTPSKGTSLNILSEGNSFDKEGKTADSRMHDAIAFEQVSSKGVKINLLHDVLALTSGGVAQPTATTDYFRLEMPKLKNANLVSEIKRVSLSNGHFENTTHLDMNFTPAKNFSLHINKLGIDRGKDPSSDTDLLDMKWQVSKTLAFTGSASQTHTNNKQDVGVRSFGLTGLATKDIQIAANFSEVNQIGKNVKIVKDYAISNTKPMNVLGMKQVTVTAKYQSLDDQHKQQTQNAGAKIQGMIGKNAIGLEYMNVLDAKGQNGVSRAFTFVTEKNAKLPFFADILYKARNVNHGGLQLVRKYNLGLNLGKIGTLGYTYVSLPEDGAGVMQPTKVETFSFKSTVSKTMTAGLEFSNTLNFAQHTAVNKLMASVGQKVDRATNVSVGYSIDRNSNGSATSDSHTISLGIDHKIDNDHFLALTSAYVAGRGGVRSGLQYNVDYKTRF